MYAQSYEHSFLISLFGSVQRIKDWIGKHDQPRLVLALMEEDEFKTYKQNRLFHKLLELFWKSGVASYTSYDDLRRTYKRLAGLVKVKDGVIIEGSWSEVKKSQAKFAIDSLLHEMDISGVIGTSVGKQYEQILQGIGAL